MASHTLTELQTLEPVTIDARSYAVAPSRMSHERPAEASPVASMANTTPTTILSRTRAIIVITQLTGLTLFGSFCNGAIVVGLPAIATSLQLEEGTKRVSRVGAFLSATFALAFGLARTGGELIAFRALHGVANAIFVPSSISIISMNMKEGIPRNLGFACLGFASTIGFSLGLVLGGILVDRTGWRPAFYLAGAISFVLAFIGIWALPGDKRLPSNQSVWKQLASQIDWIEHSSREHRLGDVVVCVVILAPLNCDMLFTVGLLVVSGVFPKHMQALSGAVFNTCAQLGTAIGLTLASVISTSVSNASHETNKASPSALMEGYRAVFWTMLAWMLAVCLTCLFGLRRVEGVGMKRD
ncbi:putative Major facilitator superfamily (MFS) profile domain-containing protein [Seiridium unicorne]|uniref:Major facilitator superfamily (MFS) profile domain-containing protein n=1 Tax=Seiridium unicorne TaxID=138068 RepID=A0ABR2V9U7_9PEZI